MAKNHSQALPNLIAAERARLQPVPVSLDNIGHSVGITTAATRALSPSAVALIDGLTVAATCLQLEHPVNSQPVGSSGIRARIESAPVSDET